MCESLSNLTQGTLALGFFVCELAVAVSSVKIPSPQVCALGWVLHGLTLEMFVQLHSYSVGLHEHPCDSTATQEDLCTKVGSCNYAATPMYKNIRSRTHIDLYARHACVQHMCLAWVNLQGTLRV